MREWRQKEKEGYSIVQEGTWNLKLWTLGTPFSCSQGRDVEFGSWDRRAPWLEPGPGRGIWILGVS